MSPSPDRDRDTVLDPAIVAASIDFPDGKKKRSNSEATEYPRRRATIAVRLFLLRIASFIASQLCRSRGC